MGVAGFQELRLLPSGSEWNLSVKAGEAGDAVLTGVTQKKMRPQAHKRGFESRLGSPRLRVDTQASPIAARVQAYAHYLGQLLDASLVENQSVEQAGSVADTGYDLLVWAEPIQSRAKQLFFGSPVYRILERAPVSLLVGRKPRWPLRQILLIVRSEAVHSLAVSWTIRLAQASGARVTALVVVPLISPLSSREAKLAQGLTMLLAGDSLLEQQIRYVSRRLTAGGLEASLRLRQGTPEQQIQAELSAESYDLVVVAAESRDWWLRRLVGESIEPVLNRANCPVLIASLYQEIRLDQELIAECRSGEI